MLWHYAEFCYAECHVLFTITLNVILPSVIMLSVIMLSVVAPFVRMDKEQNQP